jgi:MFS family permease
MYLFIGLLQGVGACAAIPLPLTTVATWFVRRQGLALGIASAGIGVGAATVPLLVSFIESHFGWRTAMLILGVLIILIYVPIALLVVRPPDAKYLAAHEGLPQTKDPKDAEAIPDLSLPAALKTKQFWSLFAIFGFCVLCVGLIITHLVPYASDNGISPLHAASLLTVMGLSSIVGRLGSGFVSDRLGATPVIFCGILLQGLMILALSQIGSLGLFYLFATLFGIAYGGVLVMIPRLTALIFGMKYMGAIYGSLSVADGIGFAVGPLLAGYLFDVFGNYNGAFLITASGIFLAGMSVFFLKQKP